MSGLQKLKLYPYAFPKMKTTYNKMRGKPTKCSVSLYKIYMLTSPGYIETRFGSQSPWTMLLKEGQCGGDIFLTDFQNDPLV